MIAVPAFVAKPDFLASKSNANLGISILDPIPIAKGLQICS